MGAPVGGAVGAIMGIDEKITLDGKSDKDVELVLKKLNSKSRFPVKR